MSKETRVIKKIVKDMKARLHIGEQPPSMGILDYLAFSQMTLDAKAKGMSGTCWLVTSDEVKATERERVLDQFNSLLLPAAKIIVPLDVYSFDKALENIVPAEQLESLRQSCKGWQEYESKMAAEREAGNPRAFFVTDQVAVR